MKRKKGGGGGGANWMDTYGDMVTLLLCFFVLLYSMSSVDQQKWEAIVRSFNPNAVAVPTEIEQSGNAGPLADPSDGQGMGMLTQEEIDDTIEKLYQAVKSDVATQAAGNNIEVTKGDGYVFISFNDAVFFEGDSYILRPEGKVVLGKVAEMLSRAGNAIDEVRVMGHTAQATMDKPNAVAVDRYLASNRATVATIYIQEHSTLNAARLVSVGYGQWRPVAGNKTSESRKKNRRVEIIITGLNVKNELGDSIEQYYAERGTNP